MLWLVDAIRESSSRFVDSLEKVGTGNGSRSLGVKIGGEQ